MENQEYIEKLTKKSKTILTWAIIGLIVSSLFICCLPKLLTTYTVVELSEKPNEIGDTIGGIMGPAVALLAAILTFLAFWVQYQANIEQKRQFDQQLSIQKIQTENQDYQYLLQQVESRVFKLVDVYISNVSQMKYDSKVPKRLFENKEFFNLIYYHFRTLLEEIQVFDFNKNISIDNRVYLDYKQSLISKNSEVDINEWVSYELAYIIIYFGVGKIGRENIKEICNQKYQDDYVRQLVNYLSKKPADSDLVLIQNDWENAFSGFEAFDHPTDGSFDKFYSNQQSRLGHYFRQLYMAINYINSTAKLNYHYKWEYSKNFRSLFSNHEQLILFFNSISMLGRDWEINHIVEGEDLSNENKRLITKYDLIKNIPKAYRIKYQLNRFYPNLDFEGENTGTNTYRENLELNVYS